MFSNWLSERQPKTQIRLAWVITWAILVLLTAVAVTAMLGIFSLLPWTNPGNVLGSIVAVSVVALLFVQKFFEVYDFAQSSLGALSQMIRFMEDFPNKGLDKATMHANSRPDLDGFYWHVKYDGQEYGFMDETSALMTKNILNGPDAADYVTVLTPIDFSRPLG